MIECRDVRKSFGEKQVLNCAEFIVPDKSFYALMGTNGAGKSTLMRIITGIYKPDFGTVKIDDMNAFDNDDAKRLFYFIPDSTYFFKNATAKEMAIYLSSVYENFDMNAFIKYIGVFSISIDHKIRDFSKGMKRITALLLGICSGTKYLLCDETFDGLDPVARQSMKSLIGEAMDERGLTVLATSHNLRETEDICDHIGMCHQGRIIEQTSLDDAKMGACKIQCVFAQDDDSILDGLNILSKKRRGKLLTLVIQGDITETENFFRAKNPIFYELLPLSLEEIFTSKMEGEGYDIKELILN